MSKVRIRNCVFILLILAAVPLAVWNVRAGSADRALARYLASQEVLDAGSGWWTDHSVIRHAGGGIDGLSHSNSKEAIEQSLAAGERFLEIDFSYTSDGRLVAMHQWTAQWDGTVADYDTFMNGAIFGRYTPLDLESVMAYMAKYPDLYLLVDTKETDAFYDVISDVVDACPDVSRLVFYVYGSGQKETIQSSYDINDDQFIMLDRDYSDYATMLADCYEDDIFIVCVNYAVCGVNTLKEFVSRGFITYAYTVNRYDHLEKLVAEYGITGIVTDFLTGSDFISVRGQDWEELWVR